MWWPYKPDGKFPQIPWIYFTSDVIRSLLGTTLLTLQNTGRILRELHIIFPVQ